MSDTTGATGASPRLTAVAQTAMLVAAARLAETRRDNPVLTDELLEAMIGSSGEVIAAVRQCIQETQQQERGWVLLSPHMQASRIPCDAQTLCLPCR